MINAGPEFQTATERTGSKQERSAPSEGDYAIHYRFFTSVVYQSVVLVFVSALLVAPAFADGASDVTNTFKPDGTPARVISEYTILVLAICGVIFVIVAGLPAYTAIRFRRRAGDEGQEPPQVYGSNQIELAWTVLPVLIVFVLSLVTAQFVGTKSNSPAPR